MYFVVNYYIGEKRIDKNKALKLSVENEVIDKIIANVNSRIRETTTEEVKKAV